MIIGDAIHNLRSALDLAICELVAKDTRWCKFPFHPTAEKLISAVTKGAIKVSGPAVVDAIINIIKPYKGGNDLLYALHDADIDDKHRLLIPAVSSVTVPFKTIRYGHFCIDGDESAWTVNRDNTEAKPMDLPDDFQIEYNGEPTFDVTFGEACALGHKPVIPTLHQLSQAVAGVIDELEKAHLGA